MMKGPNMIQNGPNFFVFPQLKSNFADNAVYSHELTKHYVMGVLCLRNAATLRPKKMTHENAQYVIKVASWSIKCNTSTSN